MENINIVLDEIKTKDKLLYIHFIWEFMDAQIIDNAIKKVFILLNENEKQKEIIFDFSLIKEVSTMLMWYIWILNDELKKQNKKLTIINVESELYELLEWVWMTEEIDIKK